MWLGSMNISKSEKSEELVTPQKQPTAKTWFEEKLNMTIVTSNSSLYKSSDMDCLLQNLIFVSLTVPTLQHDPHEQIPITTEQDYRDFKKGTV